jgi:hypothetical protein
MRRLLIKLLLGRFVLAVAVGLAVAPAVFTQTATFNQNLLLKSSNSAGEPSIRTDRFGRSFVIGPTGLAGGCKAFRVTHDGSSSIYLGQPDHQAGGGDCDWAIGPQETTVPASDDDLAFSSLTLPNITVGKSDDGGKTFGPPNPAAAQVGGDDRMWNVADPNLNSAGFATIFMSYHDVSVGNIEVSISIDGGQTYVQSGPLINPSDVPTAQWTAANAGNELGNLVARRDSSGRLTLYSIFETPDSEADAIAQNLAGTAHFNRIYEAVGTVTDTGAVPTVAWRNYEVFRGAVGSRFNRIFPVTTVDKAGRVYAVWCDGNSIFTKSSPNGIDWTASVVQITNPTGNNTAIMPWAQAGKAGIVDLVFYGARGGAGAQPNPQDDPANVWNVYMAQTVDGGATWTASKASDHDIHTGPVCIDGLGCDTSMPRRNRTLLDFFQVSVDPTNGAADIAYTDDQASPGSAFLYFTRQCTGTSATTGAALVNDCKVPPPVPPPPQGSTCPGPQIVDFFGDAPNNYPGGDGKNMANLDIINAFFGTPDASNLRVTVTLNDLEAPPPPVNLVSALWTVYWTYNGGNYCAEATTNGTGSTAVASLSVGMVSGGSCGSRTSTTGEFHPGRNGTFVINVPRSLVGNPPNGATLTNTFADTHGSFTVNGDGVFYTAAADRAPDSGFGANYVVGQVCPPGGGGGGGSCHEADGDGDVPGRNGGRAHLHVHENDCNRQEDTEDFSDPSSGADFHGTQVTSVTRDDAAHSVTIGGLGTNNGLPVAFTIVAVDSSLLPPGLFSITLSDGYTNTGNLFDGSITLH